MQNEESSVLDALRREPERTQFLLKLSLAVVVGLVAWDVLAAMVMPAALVKFVLALAVLAYGAVVVHLVGGIMASSGHWSAGKGYGAGKPAPAKARGASAWDDSRFRDEGDTDGPGPAEASGGPASTAGPVAFNESYFVMRLQEQVKDARRSGGEMCVAAVQVTLPGMEMTPELAQAVAYDVARIAAEQSQVMSLPLALDGNEFVFSLPHMDLDDTRQFVREVVRALGEYWCYFGIAAFPDHATDAQGLVERAREACDASVQTGKRGRVEYSVA